MKKLFALLKKIDENLIKYFVYFYIFFIPLMPKFPFKGIDYTYLKFRYDDLFIALFVGVFFIQLIRKKIEFNRKFFMLFVVFWLVVFLSSNYAVFIAKNLRFKHLAFLHSFRRIQYMFPFFVGLSVVKSQKDFFNYLKAIFISLLIVTVYGIGQKFLGWPAVQTMNPEYALGHLLVLSPEARVSSTFAGHYDLAAYLIFLIPILYGFYFFKHKVGYIFLFVFSLFVMILTASRVSFGAYLMSFLTFLLFLRKFKHLAFVIILTLIFTFMNNNLTSRIKRTFQIKRIFVNEQTGQVVIPQKSTIKELPAGSFYIPIQGGTATNAQIISDKSLAREKILSDIRWEASRSGKVLTKSQEEAILATISAGLRPISTIVSDISLATRLQIEWPRAITAFIMNPLLGTGPSSITEATDNDYLRWLGETGFLGFASFLFIIFSITQLIFKSLKNMDQKTKYIYYGFLFGLFGLMINAGWIDVFEASKVAYIFWITAGIFIGSLTIKPIYEKK